MEFSRKNKNMILITYLARLTFKRFMILAILVKKITFTYIFVVYFLKHGNTDAR